MVMFVRRGAETFWFWEDDKDFLFNSEESIKYVNCKPIFIKLCDGTKLIINKIH